MITYSQLVAKTMPPEKKKTASRCFVGHYLVRPISNIVSIPLIEWNVAPTPVTQFSAIFPIAAFCLFLLLPTGLGFWLGWLAILIWNILDGVDGNIARYCEKSSTKGCVWDATVGWLAIIAFYSGMGFVAFHNFTNTILPEYLPQYAYIVMGDLASMCWIFPRLIMHKSINTVGAESVQSVQDRGNYGFCKLVFFNFTSINGFAAVVFAACYIFGIIEYCMLCYFIISLTVAVGSLYKILK